jgi:GMP synthase (glutamine-hydrolysing)
MKQKNDLKILLMQIREDEETRLEEFMEFVQFSQLSEDQFVVLNVFETPNFSVDVVSGFDALFVGGSSDASVLDPETYTFVEPAKKLMKYCYDQNLPVLASCFGFQLAVEALGGKVILDKENMEMGTYQIEIDQAFAKNDPVFKHLPARFWAVSGHKERAETLPAGAINFASTPLCPFHAIKFENKPFYAFQFHPEIDKKDLVIRLERYMNRYLDDADEFKRIIGSTQEVPDANAIVRIFVENVLV